MVEENKLMLSQVAACKVSTSQLLSRNQPDPERLRSAGLRVILTLRQDAFTLIELLVVVLMIGILTAIAIPQYEKAVIKSRLATLKPLTESLYQAVEMYQLANGYWPSSFDELDVRISIPDRVEKPNSSQIVAYYHGDLVPCCLKQDNSSRSVRTHN